MDNHLREIRFDVWEAPGRRIESLQLDKMFERVLKWGQAHPSTPSSSSVPMPSQERLERMARPLPIHPLPIVGVVGEVSPLGRLWDYPELAPLVLQHFEKPAELAVLCRVNREWERICRRRLYESIWVRPWEENCQVKLVMLLHTLSQNSELCKLVKKLDVRFFPLATRGGDRYSLDEQVEAALREMHNLESLVWTRDKSLTPQVFETIIALPHLRSLEITGHSYRYYRPELIGQMPALEELRIMMPDSLVRNLLPIVVEDLANRPIGGLRSLGLICRLSPLIDDALLRKMAPYLRSLRRLTLWGCTRVTKGGVRDLLEEAEDMEELSLDALPHTDLQDLSSMSLPNLTTYSLSVSAPHRNPLFLTVDELPRIPTSRKISSLHLSLSGARAHLPSGGVDHILSQVSVTHLRSLSLLNFVLSAPQIVMFLDQCPNLQEFFISTNGERTLIEAIGGLAKSKLVSLHVTTSDPRWGPSLDTLEMLAGVMMECREIGTGTRVYEVHRGAEGVELRRWSKTYSPAYYQGVWRG